jgi:hypothetical protein
LQRPEGSPTGMLAVLSPLACGLVIEMGGPMIEMGPMTEFDPSMAAAFSGMDDMLKMLSADLGAMQQMSMQQMARPPINPCVQDMNRLNCQSASCLKNHLEALSPTCAKLLAGHAPHAPQQQQQRPMAPTEIDITFERDDDQWEVTSNMPPEMRNFIQSLPAEIASIFGEEAMVPTAPEPQEASHPCGPEIDQCLQMGANGRDDIERCLVANYDYLTATCKCFLHKVLPPEMAKKLSPVSPAPMVAAVDVVMPPPPYPHVSCMLLMPLFLFALIMCIRRCCLCCCKPKPQFEAVVLPPTALKTVEPLVAVPVSAPVKAEA